MYAVVTIIGLWLVLIAILGHTPYTSPMPLGEVLLISRPTTYILPMPYGFSLCLVPKPLPWLEYPMPILVLP